MTLSDWERRRLDDIAAQLEHDDPRLADALHHRHREISHRAPLIPLLIVTGSAVAIIALAAGLIWLLPVGALLALVGSALVVEHIRRKPPTSGSA
jgi:hypothetical protein